MTHQLDVLVCKPCNNKKIYVVADKLGNAATGNTLEEAMEYLNIRRRNNNNQIITFRKTESKK